jgi:pimeloyl-ACP methyl ester carboxylesterase
MRSLLGRLLSISAVLLVFAPDVNARQEASPVAANRGDFGGMVELADGRSVYVECRGTGSPTVILISGHRTRADVWTDDLFQPDSPRTVVFPGVAKTTRVCAYDRPGTVSVLDGELLPSRSDPIPMPRTAQDAVEELHALLTAIDETGPYVLAAHSLGGLLARLYASTYPDEIAGMVLVDALSEFVEAEMPADQWPAYAEYASWAPPILAAYENLETIEFIPASAALREAATASPLPSVPLIVLSKGQPFGLPDDAPGFSVETFEAAWDAAQADLAALLPGTPHRIIEESSHYIQIERPDLVIKAIDEVVAAVRAGES